MVKNALKTFAAIGFGLVALIVGAGAASVNGQPMTTSLVIGLGLGAFGALAGWYRVK